MFESVHGYLSTAVWSQVGTEPPLSLHQSDVSGYRQSRSPSEELSLALSLSPSVCHQMSLLVFLLVHSQRLIDIPKPFAPNAPNTKALHDTSALSAHEQQKADRHRKRPPVRERERELFQRKQSSPLWFVLRVQGTEKSIRETTETRRERG